MRNDNAQPYKQQENGANGNHSANNSVRDKKDLTDPERDQEYLKSEEATFDLPDVKDIPGQEFVHIPPLGILADTTISSADEEGEGIFENDSDIVMGTEADITTTDKAVLESAEIYMPTHDEDNLYQASLDHTDFEGEELNEKSFGEERSGEDLDIPGTSDGTTKDTIEQGDEENKLFSLGGDKNDSNENRS